MRVPTAARVVKTILPAQANGPAYIVRAIAPMAYARHAQRRNNHAHRTLTCTGQVLYFEHYTGLRIRSNALRIHFVSGFSVKRSSVLHTRSFISSLLPSHTCPGFKVGVRMHTPRPVGVQVNKLEVTGNNLGVSNLGVNNLGVTTTRLGPSAIPSTISCTLTSSTNTARSS